MPRGKPEKYLDIAKKIQQYIRSNAIPSGSILPSERSLAEKYQCNHLTIRKALRKLEQSGMVYKVPSIGNFAGPRPRKENEKDTIGIIFPDDDLYYYRLLSRLETVFERLHLYPIVKLTNHVAAKEDTALDFFQEEKVCAVIAVPNVLCAKRYEEMRCPVLFFDLYPERSSIPHIISDDFSGAFSAVEYLCSLGHRRIAYIGSLQDLAAAKRYGGYLAALKKNGIEPEKRYIRRRTLTREWGMQAASELLSQQNSPSAILCANDTAAAGVVRYCVSQGIRIPEDLSLVGFGNTEIAEDLFLTSVSQHSDKIASAIGEMLLLMLEGKDVPLETVIPENTVLRNSVAKFTAE